MSFSVFLSIPMFGAPGIWELLIIAGVVVLIFGASKLPRLGKGLGEGIRNFKTGLKGETEDNNARGDSQKPEELSEKNDQE